MAILTGNEILNKITEGSIKIEPFNESNINPNSYNLTLGKELLIYNEGLLDSKRPNNTTKLTIPDQGLILQPGRLYLAKTQEYTETKGLVPVLHGRSSLGRLGLFVHVTAGYGDVGYAGNWTLELMAVQPLKIYPGMKICQIVYNTIQGEATEYNGKYQNSTEVVASKFHEDK